MSFQAMALAVKIKTDSPTDKLVLLMLANYANEEMQSYPSYATLARECCMSDRAVKVAMGRLKKQGLVTWVKRKKYCETESKELTSNLYTLHLEDKPTTNKKKRPENTMPMGGMNKKSSENTENTGSADYAPPSAESAQGVVNNLHRGSERNAQNTISDTEGRKEESNSKNSDEKLYQKIMATLLLEDLANATEETIRIARFKAHEYQEYNKGAGKLAAGCMYVIEGLRIQQEKAEDLQAIADMEAHMAAR